MILVCGEALIDLVPLAWGDEPTYVARAGGSSFNVAMGLGRLGAPVTFRTSPGPLPASPAPTALPGMIRGLPYR